MRKRATKKVLPLRMPWFRVQVDDAVYTLRLPSLGLAFPVQQRIAEAQSAAGENISDFDAMECALGDWMLMSFDDTDFELEGSTGREVYEELRDAGWAYKTFLSIIDHSLTLLESETVREREVEQKVDFFAPQAMGQHVAAK